MGRMVAPIIWLRTPPPQGRNVLTRAAVADRGSRMPPGMRRQLAQYRIVVPDSVRILLIASWTVGRRRMCWQRSCPASCDEVEFTDNEVGTRCR